MAWFKPFPIRRHEDHSRHISRSDFKFFDTGCERRNGHHHAAAAAVGIIVNTFLLIGWQ
jgi:hypothetical protein